MTNELRSITTRQAWSLGAIGALLLIAALILAADTWTGFGFDADGEEMTRLTAALSLRPGMVVADIGAGQGQLSAALARVVGAGGHVFSTDIDPGRVQRLRVTMAAAGLGNVTVLSAAARDSGLSASCCDAIVVRRVYHHLSDSPATIASLLRGLRSGGLLAVIDFPPPPLFSSAAASACRRRSSSTKPARPVSRWSGSTRTGPAVAPLAATACCCARVDRHRATS